MTKLLEHRRTDYLLTDENVRKPDIKLYSNMRLGARFGLVMSGVSKQDIER